jgi:arabinose-5-phosphate isomerase
MIALGDAMAFCLIKANQFCQEDFAKFHPAGSLGKKLMRVETVMRHGHELRLASAQDTVRAVFSKASQPGRRTGAVILIDSDEKLCGIFTDSDLARLIETRNDNALDKPISEVMTKNPKTILLGSKVVDAIELMKQKKLSEIPVVDATNTPRGLLDITDLISLAPAMVLPSSKVA